MEDSFVSPYVIHEEKKGSVGCSLREIKVSQTQDEIALARIISILNGGEGH